MFFYNFSLPQQYFNTRKHYSINEKYCMEIKGYYYDDFFDTCQYFFISSMGEVLWEKELVYGGIPELSINGDIAIPTQAQIL